MRSLGGGVEGFFRRVRETSGRIGGRGGGGRRGEELEVFGPAEREFGLEKGGGGEAVGRKRGRECAGIVKLPLVGKSGHQSFEAEAVFGSGNSFKMGTSEFSDPAVWLSRADTIMRRAVGDGRKPSFTAPYPIKDKRNV
nr:hypothetical protein Iba_chr10bCG1590 [Ipomoea batatas]